MIRTILTAAAMTAATLAAAPADASPATVTLAADGGTRVPCPMDEPLPGTDPQGCVWDARHMGNGVGRSFVVRPSGRLVFVTHTRAHYLLTGVTL